VLALWCSEKFMTVNYQQKQTRQGKGDYMDNVIRTEQYKGYTIQIVPDDIGESPREWDNLGIMVCSHKRYNLGDEQINSDEYNSWDEVRDALIAKYEPVVILPLGLYDHSGITMYIGDTHDRWDGGQVGFILVPKAKALKEWDVKHISPARKAQIKSILENEVKTYDQYLRGEVVGYQIIKDNQCETCQHVEHEVKDSCYGYYSEEDAIAEAKSMIDCYTAETVIATGAITA
jgi:hypothetical protein